MILFIDMKNVRWQESLFPDHDPGEHDTGGHADDDHYSDHIHVVEFNFKHVKAPLLVGVVVIIAGLSKIGMAVVSVSF